MTDAEIDQLREMVKENPEVTELKKKWAALSQEIEVIDTRISELTGTTGKRRGRKPGAVTKVQWTTGKRRGRPAKAISTPETRATAAKAPKVKKPMTAETRAKRLAALEKARAAKAANKGKVKRVIVDNDLIRPVK